MRKFSANILWKLLSLFSSQMIADKTNSSYIKGKLIYWKIENIFYLGKNPKSLQCTFKLRSVSVTVLMTIRRVLKPKCQQFLREVRNSTKSVCASSWRSIQIQRRKTFLCDFKKFTTLCWKIIGKVSDDSLFSYWGILSSDFKKFLHIIFNVSGLKRITLYR